MQQRLPLRIDHAGQPEGRRIDRDRDTLLACQLLDQAANRGLKGLVGVAADRQIVLPRLALSPERVPHGNPAGLADLRVESGRYEGQQRVGGIFAGLRHICLTDIGEFVGDKPQGFRQQGLFAVEVKIDHRRRQPHFGADLAQRDIGQSVLGNG